MCFLRGLAAAVTVLALAGCGGESTDVTTDDQPGSRSEAPVVALPFGLEQVEGTRPIGRPVVYEQTAFNVNDQAVPTRSLRAAFRVTGDPGDVFERWIAQLSRLRLGEVALRPETCGGGSVDGLMCSLSVYAPPTPEGIGGDTVGLQMWATDDLPVLLVWASRRSDPGPETVVGGEFRGPTAVSSPTISWEDLEDPVLFVEQGSSIDVPDGAERLMPTIPVSAGTGGSYSVLSTDDAEGAIAALLSAARSSRSGEYAQVDGPTRSTVDGLTAVAASFNIPAGGWGFSAIAVEGEGDDLATLYVETYAD